MQPHAIIGSSFFTIPIELREEIYRHALSTTPSNVSLLRTCHRVYAEAQPHIFHRTLQFDSQTDLFNWLDHVSSSNLRYVNTIRLRLQDIDLSPVLNAPLKTDKTLFLSWRLYENELSTFDSALRRLPNIRDFSLIASGQSQSHLYREFLAAFTGLLSHHYDDLSHFSMLGSYESVDFLASMRNLRSLRFTSSSISTSTEIDLIISKLPHLVDLEIVLQPFAAQTEPTSGSPPTIQPSFTPQVLRQLRPLSSFKIREQRVSSLQGGMFSLKAMIESLTTTHTASLRRLCLSLSSAPGYDSQTALQSFLSSSSIRHLDISWPAPQPDSLSSMLPATLRTLRVAVSSDTMAFDLLWGIIKRRKETPLLHEIVLVESPEEAEDDIVVDNDATDSGDSHKDAEGEEDEIVVLQSPGSNGEDDSSSTFTSLRTDNEDARYLDLAIRELRFLGVRTLKGLPDSESESESDILDHFLP